MKRINKFLLGLIFAFVLSFAVQAQNADWIRVQSDNGEFSIEVPQNFGYFFDKDGFEATYDQNNYRLKNVNILNAYFDKTLVSFEAYDAKPDALNGYIEDDKRTGIYSELKQGDTVIKQIVSNTKDFYLITRYFSSKKYVYVLNVASKNGETPVMKRFFDSLIFKPNTKNAPDTAIPSFSKLVGNQVAVGFIKDEKNRKDSPTKNSGENPKTEEQKATQLLIVKKPRASYVDVARMKAVKGIVSMKLEFAPNGMIPKVDIIKTLPEGLLRQSLFAALRMKFFPKEENGKTIATTKVVQYSFTIY